MASGLDENKNFSWTSWLRLENEVNTPYGKRKKSELDEDRELKKNKPEDVDLHHVRSDWNELCLICCEICQNIVFHQAFNKHMEVRHLQHQDSSLYQHRLYIKKFNPNWAQECEEKMKVKETAVKKSKTDSKDNDSGDNAINHRNVKFRPGCENNKRRKTNYGPIIEKQRIPQIVHALNEETRTEQQVDCQQQGVENCEIKYPTEVASAVQDYFLPNIPSKNLVNDPSFSWFSANSWLVLGLPLPNQCPNINHNEILEKFPDGASPKRFTDITKESGQRNFSALCAENLTQVSSFHDENNDYLESLGDGSQLCSSQSIRERKPDVKLKNQPIREKTVYKQYLQMIKLEPSKIRNALKSIKKYTAQKKCNFKHFYI